MRRWLQDDLERGRKMPTCGVLRPSFQATAPAWHSDSRDGLYEVSFSLLTRLS